jgi:hypothetical protein
LAMSSIGYSKPRLRREMSPFGGKRTLRLDRHHLDQGHMAGCPWHEDHGGEAAINGEYSVWTQSAD